MRMTGGELALRRPARISKLDIKASESIREKMNAQGTMLGEITRKQLIWCGHVERMDRTRLPDITVNWKLETGRKEGKNEAVHEEPGKMGYIQRWVGDS